MDISGKIKLVFDQQTFDSGFRKREFVVTTQEQYPQEVKFECIQDRCNLLDDYSAGDDVKVHFNVKGREYNGRYFVNLQAWKIEANGSENTATAEGNSPFPSEAPADFSDGDETDDLPF